MMKVEEEEYCEFLEVLINWHARALVGAVYDDDGAYIPLTEFARGGLIAADAATLLRRAAHNKGVSERG